MVIHGCVELKFLILIYFYEKSTKSDPRNKFDDHPAHPSNSASDWTGTV